MGPLAQWMKLTGVKDAELADKVGVSRVQILRLRRGKNRPSFKTAHELARVTQLPVASLILNEEAA